MKRITRLIAAAIIIMCLVSCGNEEPFEGTVCELEFKPETTYTTMIPITNKIGDITTITLIPIIHRYPDRWYVKVITPSGECRDCYVSRECFEGLAIGDWFIYDGQYCSEKEPCETEKAE